MSELASGIPPADNIDKLLRDEKARIGIVEGRCEAPKNIAPTPTPRFIDADGNPAPGRAASAGEQAQNDKLYELSLKNIDTIAGLQQQYFVAELERIELWKNPHKGMVVLLKPNADLLNSLGEQIYMLQRKNVEMLHAIRSIKRSIVNGYPPDTVVVPDHVFNPNRIGTAQGGSTWIQAVLKED